MGNGVSFLIIASRVMRLKKSTEYGDGNLGMANVRVKSTMVRLTILSDIIGKQDIWGDGHMILQ